MKKEKCCFHLFSHFRYVKYHYSLHSQKIKFSTFSCKYKITIIAISATGTYRLRFLMDFNSMWYMIINTARKIVFNIDWPFVQDNQNKNLFSTMLVCFDVYFQSLHYKVLCCILMRFQVRRSSVKLFCYIIQIKEISLWYRREVVKKQR